MGGILRTAKTNLEARNRSRCLRHSATSAGSRQQLRDDVTKLLANAPTHALTKQFVQIIVDHVNDTREIR
jgi:hypothetical protein